MKQKVLINMAADRGAFIDQSQSFNVFFGHPDVKILTAIHFYGWKKVSIPQFLHLFEQISIPFLSAYCLCKSKSHSAFNNFFLLPLV